LSVPLRRGVARGGTSRFASALGAEQDKGTTMSKQDLGWTVPVMRTGYAGRGLVYLIVAGISLYSIWRGGQAEGTSSALGWLDGSAWGTLLLCLVALGMFAYAVWRIIDAIYDLEDYGSDGKGAIARTGMVTTAIAHAAIGVTAFSLVFQSGGGGGGSGSAISDYVATVLGWPAGRWIVGAIALILFGTAIYYVRKGWKEKYREHIQGTPTTERLNPVLKIGTIAQGVVIGIVGVLFFYAAWQGDPSEAGGTEAVFGWLSQQVYGQTLVVILCVGLLAFAIVCFVNAWLRYIPKVAGPDVATLAARLKAKAS